MKHHEDICAEVRSGLPLFVGGDLEAQATADIERHLHACADCRQSEQAAREARTLLVSALELSERRGPDLWPNVRAVLSEQGLFQPVAPGPRASPALAAGAPARPARAWTRYAAATAAALLVGLWLGRAVFDEDAVPDQPTQGGADLVAAPEAAPPRDLSQPGPTLTAPIVPVVSDGGLRRLARDERRLREGADIYLDLPWMGAPSPFDTNQAAPAGLQRPPRMQ